jgi:nucleotide-binding universal stress UspA family protein
MASARVKIERVLCPTDFSDFSRSALERAVSLARWFEARLTVLHVNPRVAAPTAIHAGVYAMVPPDFLEVQRRAAQRELDRLVGSLLGEGVAVEGKLVEGNPARAIQAEAAGLGADLVVMGTHGRSGVEHLVLGSVAERVLRTAPCPVLTIRAGAPAAGTGPLFRRILCGVDLTAASQRTIEMAVSLAEEALGRVTLLHVIEGMLGESGPELYRPIPERAALRQALAAEAKRKLRLAARQDHGLSALDERVETGSAWRQIVRVADESYADLVVVGAHAGGAVGRMFFGSTANQVVRHAGCPVLTVREVRSASLQAATVSGFQP